MKKCIHCGAELPEEASFCPQCAKSQMEPAVQEPPRIWRKKSAMIGAVCAVVLVLIAAVATVFYLTRPKLYEGTAALDYQGYHMVLVCDGGPEPREPQQETVKVIPPNSRYGIPAQLIVYRSRDMQNAAAEFMEQVERISVHAVPREGGAEMEANQPVPGDGPFSNAAAVSDIFFDSLCGTNDVYWNILMKNGDTLFMYQTLSISQMPTVSYYADTTPMNTIEELEALMADIEANTDPNTIISLYLPPVTYEGGLSMKDRTYSLYGTTDGNRITTFTGPITVDTEAPVFAELDTICIQGHGAGTGVMGSGSVVLTSCQIRNWEVGTLATDGTFIAVHGCTYTGNRVGMQVNSEHGHLLSNELDGSVFEDNGTAIHLIRVNSDYAPVFNDCRFARNEIDIQNDAGAPIDNSNAIFE